MKAFNIIVAMDEKGGIGKSGNMPWHLPSDLKHFKEITSATCLMTDTGVSKEKKNVVVMGRKTWDSVPEEFRPLSDRSNVVLTKNKDIQFPDGVIVAHSFEDIQRQLDKKSNVGEVFVIGGQQIFEAAIKHSMCFKIYATHIDGDFQCDTFFPRFKNHFKQTAATEKKRECGMSFFFAEYQRI